MNKKHTWTHLAEEARSVHLLKIDDFSVNNAPIQNIKNCIIKYRCSVDGYDWEIRFFPAHRHHKVVALELIFLGEARTGSVMANLGGKIIFEGTYSYILPYQRKTVPKEFHRPWDRSPLIYLGVGIARDGFDSSTLMVECTITVFGEPASIPVPSSDLSRHLGELLQSQAGADVTFAVSGESFEAHKGVLAARCPVFMAEFFGEMKEKDAQLVEIQDMDAAVFKAMLHFIYTDAVPELQERSEAAMTLAQHLLVAADRYGLDRLKVMCERSLTLEMDVSMVASTLALAEQHNCSRLKAKCIEFIAGGSMENLDAVLATEGYKHLVLSSPMVLTELLKAAHGKKRSRSPDTK